ncbi:MAG: hypothetical protein M1822_003711 [Bathelium mastoideum]|nr:MAG: hypothetical protein M1822_003711 [Bathelium mastoideum]
MTAMVYSAESVCLIGSANIVKTVAEPESNPRNLVKPCEVFDLIVGTSTGGLIAIMLGRLEMDVQSCIDAYRRLSRKIFKPRNRTWCGGATAHKLLGSSTFSAEVLEKEIKKVIRDNGSRIRATTGNEGTLEEIPMLDETGQRCKIFVCCTLENGRAYRIRSYNSTHEPGLPFTVWQAARATTAAPGFFDPLRFEDIATLRDGGLRNNNPINEVMDEIRTEFDDRDISCLISIGSGVSKTEVFGRGLVSIAKKCAKIATDTEQAERTFRSNHASPNQRLHGRYFRFQVEQGLQGFGMDEWENMNRIWTVTTSYLDDSVRRNMLSQCGEKLAQPRSMPDLGPSSETPSFSEAVIRYHEFLGLHSTNHFVGREEDLSWMEKKLWAKNPTRHDDSDRRPKVIALTGLGGSGKTQLMLRYAETRAKYYSAVFWIDARSKDTIEESFRGFARLLMIGSSTNINVGDSQQSSALIRVSEVDDVHAFKRWIQIRRHPWLLLFDNLVDPLLLSSISTFFPPVSSSAGHILMTSRRQLNLSGWLSRKIAGLDIASARSLLFGHAQISHPTETHIADATRIVEELGAFPLSISLAASYIQVVGTLDRYLKYYDDTVPSENGVPPWFIEMFSNENGEWSELAVLEDIYRLESLSFIQKESSEGSWIYRDHVIKNLGGGKDSLIIRMEPFIQEIGRLMLGDNQLQAYAAAAICIAIHAIEDDPENAMRLRKSSSNLDDNFVALLPTGGMSNTVPGLMLNLEECYGHIHSASQCYPNLRHYLTERGIRILDYGPRCSKPLRCWLILAGICLGGRAVGTACYDKFYFRSSLAFASLIMENALFLIRLYDEKTMAFWALTNQTCRVAEWLLWTRTCWTHGTNISITRPNSLRLEEKLSIKSAESATFIVNFKMIYASILERWIAASLKMNPFKSADLPFKRAYSSSPDMYVKVLTDGLFREVKRWLPQERRDVDIMAFYQSWNWIFKGSIPYRDDVELINTEGLFNWEKLKERIPRMPVPPEPLLNEFMQSSLYRHIKLGVEIVTIHWLRDPVEDSPLLTT